MKYMGQFKRIFNTNYFSRPSFAIDLGTANTLIMRKGNTEDEVIVDQPSVVAIKTKPDSNEEFIAAVGAEAKEMIGRTPTKIKTIRPLRDGVIADFQITERMLQYFFKKACPKSMFRFQPEIIICVPCGSTQVERRAIKESALSAGAKRVYLIEEPMAAAIGAGLPVEAPSASMIVDIGGGTTEVAIISLNGIVYAHPVRVGGDRFDEAIITYVRRNFGCLIGESTAEAIKKEIGTAFPSHDVKEMIVSGRSLSEGVPKSFTITSNEVLEAIQEPLTGILDAVRSTLECAPPELSSDLDKSGIVVAGGGALLQDIDRLISEETGLPVIIADDPLTCVVRGGSKVLDILHKCGREFVSTD